MRQAHDVITELPDLDADDPLDQATAADIHAAHVALESLDAGPRQLAHDWLAHHDHDTDDEASAYRRAIAHATRRAAGGLLDLGNVP